MTSPNTDDRASRNMPSSLPKCEPEHLTRRQAAEFVRDVLGRPFSFSTATKLAALGEFAQPALWWGRRPLYRPADLRAWAEGRSRPHAKNKPQPAEPRVSKTSGQL